MCQAERRRTSRRTANESVKEEPVTNYRLLKASILGLPLFYFAAAGAQAQAPQAADPTKNLKPVTSETLRSPPAADWLMWRRTYDGFGYSPLDQINKDNVK